MNTGQPLDERVVRFLKKHHVLTLATVAEGQAHCANLFYAWMEPEQAFVFTSSLTTKHAADALANSEVAGSVVLESRTVGKLQGLQLRGVMYRPTGEALRRAKARYLKRFPYAAVADLELWLLELRWAKMTDNTLGFGQKIIWER
jgi:uncharacterized protein YhbP (UPF0306 family)